MLCLLLHLSFTSVILACVVEALGDYSMKCAELSSFPNNRHRTAQEYMCRLVYCCTSSFTEKRILIPHPSKSHIIIIFTCRIIPYHCCDREAEGTDVDEFSAEKPHVRCIPFSSLHHLSFSATSAVCLLMIFLTIPLCRCVFSRMFSRRMREARLWLSGDGGCGALDVSWACWCRWRARFCWCSCWSLLGGRAGLNTLLVSLLVLDESRWSSFGELLCSFAISLIAPLFICQE